MSLVSYRPRRISYSTALTAARSAGKMVRYAKSLYSQRSQLPSRNRVSKKRTKQTKKVERTMKNFSGSKYRGKAIDCKSPVSKPAGTQPINYMFLNSGKDLTGLTGSYVNYTPLDLFQFPQGDGNTQRVGDYMYIRHSKIKIEIQALSQNLTGSGPTGGQPILQFRFMVVKSNRKFDPLGSLNDPGDSLFLTTENQTFGYGIPGESSTATTFSNFGQPINKRDWLVYCDKRFKLSAPVLGDMPPAQQRTNNAYEKYNTKKYISLNLPVSKKVHFDNNTNTPDNLDTQWLMVIQCVHGSYCTDNTQAPRNWRLNLLGTTSAYDN